MRWVALLLLLASLLLVACESEEKAVPTTEPTPAPSPTADNSAYLREASRLIGLTNDAINSINDLIDHQNYSSVALYSLAFGVYAEQWRENEPPESYRNRHDLVQRALDRLEQVGNQAVKGTLDVADMILAGSTFKSAAENFKKPVP